MPANFFKVTNDCHISVRYWIDKLYGVSLAILYALVYKYDVQNVFEPSLTAVRYQKS